MNIFNGDGALVNGILSLAQKMFTPFMHCKQPRIHSPIRPDASHPESCLSNMLFNKPFFTKGSWQKQVLHKNDEN